MAVPDRPAASDRIDPPEPARDTAADHDTVGEWLRVLHDLYPPADAEDWDQVGLHVGAADDPVSGVLLTLDVTPAVIDEAVAHGADLVLAHHPLLFRPLRRLTPDTAAGRIALHAARRGVAIAAAHTNLDAAVGGTSDPVAVMLGLTGVRPLTPLPRPPRRKLVTFTPSDATAQVRAALAGAGAGVIGEYRECSFSMPGTGTFRPSAAASPAVGERGQLNEVAEDRLEMVVDKARVAAVLTALRAAHPYEEVAYDLLPLVDEPSPDKGLGRVGDLHRPQPLGALARRIARELPSPHLRLAGDPHREVRRVAVCGGAGDNLIDAAVGAGAELYVTGDLRHHPTLDARTRGIALIDAGHHCTEVAALPATAEALTRRAAEGGLRARLIASRTRTDPWVPPGELWGDRDGPDEGGAGRTKGTT